MVISPYASCNRKINGGSGLVPTLRFQKNIVPRNPGGFPDELLLNFFNRKDTDNVGRPEASTSASKTCL